MKKAIAVVSAIAVVAALFVGVSFTKSAKADSAVTLKPWSFYEGGEQYRSTDPEGWPERFYNTVTTTAGESKGSDFWFVGPHKQYQDGPEVIWDTTKVANGFTADIKTTGWDGEYTVTPTGNNPWFLRAYMENIPMLQAHKYTLSFSAKWTNRKNAPEKNILIGLENAYGESIFKDYPDQANQIKVASGSTTNYSFDFCLYAGNTLTVKLAYGYFLRDHEDGKTTEDVAAAGDLQISDFSIIDKGLDPTVPTDPPAPSTTARPTQAPTQAPTVAPQPTKAPTPSIKKLNKVTGIKIKSVKKKKIKVTWKKTANAKSYTLKVKGKTYTSTKASKTIKNKKFKKGKKVKVQIRANAPGYTSGPWASKSKKLTK